MGAGFDDLAGEGEAVDYRGAEPGISEGFCPGGEGLVGGDGDRRAFLSFGEDLEQQFGAAAVELQVAQFVELSRYRNRSTYADPVTMPPALRVSERSCWLTSYRLVSRL